MTRGRPDYRLLDHTADTGIELRAPTLPLLFERAAAAMFDLMVDIEAVGEAGPPERVEVEAPDEAALLAAWLSELLGRAMARGAVFGRFSVTELSGSSLAGRAWGEPLDPVRHRFKTELKAVTYHDLAVVREAPGYRARVIFDL